MISKLTIGRIVIAILVLPSVAYSATCTTEGPKIDCLPGKSPQTKEDCDNQNCCWQEGADISKGVPPCSYPKGYAGYVMTSLHPNYGGLEAILERRAPPSLFPNDIQTLSLTIQFINKDILHIKINDSVKERFEPPLPKIDLNAITRIEKQYNYRVKVQPDPATFQIIRRSTDETLFDTSAGSLIFADQFLQLSTVLPTTNLYGLGEHYDWFNRGRNPNTYTIFNRGELVPKVKSGFNLYGHHPFYLSLEKSGQAHGVLLLNSNAMDVVVQPSNPSLTYRTIGGVLDFYVFLGPSPDEVVQQYTSVIGRPFLIPYWTLGFHLCRYKYNTTADTKDTWIRNRDAGIPLDAMWSDIDYMDDMKDFTFSPTRMSGLKSFVEEMHSSGVRYVMNNSPGLSGVEPAGTYAPLDEAKQLDILIRDYKGDILKAVVWQNTTYMLDFSNPKILPYWEKHFRAFHGEVLFDAAWIDMNEPYSFIMGSHNGCPEDNLLDNPPYVPGREPLFNGTICMSAKQHLSTHYNLHTLYAIMETAATNIALKNILKKRPFVLSRGSFPGHGFWGAHWSGDIHSSWEHMQYSIPNMLNFNMYGIPMIGSDICGFVGNTTEELCTRWMQLGAFYPFSRNHNDFDTILQDPGIWDNKATRDIMKAAVETRYYLLPFFYTQMVHSHLDGTPAVRPLFFDFPMDKNTYENDRQFIWGQVLMVIPALQEGATKVIAYLPASVWYDYYTGKEYESKGEEMTFEAPIDKINLLLREGYIVPAQEIANTTSKSRNNPFNLIATLSKQGKAQGELYWDDGESLDSVTSELYNQIKFQIDKNTLTIQAAKNGYETKMELSQVKIYGVNQPEIKKIMLNGTTEISSYTFDSKVLQINSLTIQLQDKVEIAWYS